jgi:hypothetical protein
VLYFITHPDATYRTPPEQGLIDRGAGRATEERMTLLLSGKNGNFLLGGQVTETEPHRETVHLGFR